MSRDWTKIRYCEVFHYSWVRYCGILLYFYKKKTWKIQRKSNSNSDINPSNRNWKTGTDRQEQGTWDRLTRIEWQRQTDEDILTETYCRDRLPLTYLRRETDTGWMTKAAARVRQLWLNLRPKLHLRPKLPSESLVRALSWFLLVIALIYHIIYILSLLW